MKILLFLGSGISFPSNLPNVNELTTKVLNDSYHDHTDQTFYQGNHPSEYFQEQNIVPRLQAFLKLLKEMSSNRCVSWMPSTFMFSIRRKNHLRSNRPVLLIKIGILAKNLKLALPLSSDGAISRGFARTAHGAA